MLGLVILRPAAYWALTKLKNTSWHTREVAHSRTWPSRRACRSYELGVDDDDANY